LESVAARAFEAAHLNFPGPISRRVLATSMERILFIERRLRNQLDSLSRTDYHPPWLSRHLSHRRELV